MRKILCLLVLGSCFFDNSLLAQSISPAEIRLRGEMGEMGYIPQDLESLVGTSTLIVKGKFGRHLSHGLYFGEGETFSSVKAKTGLSDEDVEQLGIPRSKYELIVDEVLLGELEEESIVYNLTEEEPRAISPRFTDPSIERIFFLIEKSDGTYSTMGFPSTMNLLNGVYTYDTINPRGGAIVINQSLDFMVMSSEKFESTLDEQIGRELEIRERLLTGQ